MCSKWKNILFWCIVILLILGIVLQGNELINNIGNQTSLMDRESFIEGYSVENIEEEGDIRKKGKDILDNDFLKIIMKKAIPMMDLGYRLNGDENSNVLLLLFNTITKINMKDPKTILASQITILESFEPDDVQLSAEDQRAIYEELAQKPMNNDEIIKSDHSQPATNLGKGEPLVLIYHTHTTESYTSTADNEIEYISPWRSLDKSKNMARIGKEVKRILEEDFGIHVVHDTTLHDYPDYSVSYTRSLQTAERILKEYPSIKYVFDLHRDGLTDNQKNRNLYLTAFGDQKTARISLVVGNDNFNSEQNKKFAQKIQKKMNQKYPGMGRSIIDRDNRKYNQFVSDYATLIEVGSNLNTLEEALKAAKSMGKVIGEVILEIEGE